MTSSAVAQSPVTVLPAAPFVDVLGRAQAPDPFLGLDPRWTHIERVPFGATVVIDHVVMSAAGVYVASVASTLDVWTDSSPVSACAISEARWRGRKIESLLRSVGRPRVTPMLLLDGPRTPAIPGGYEVVDGVLVCHRADATWLCARPRRTVADARTRPDHRVGRAHRRPHPPHRAGRPCPGPSALDRDHRERLISFTR